MNGTLVQQNYRTRNQSTSLNERWNDTGDLRKTISEADSRDKRSYPDSSKSFTKGRNIGVKMGDH